MTSRLFPDAAIPASRAGKRAADTSPLAEVDTMQVHQRKAFGLWFIVWISALLSAAVMCAGCTTAVAPDATTADAAPSCEHLGADIVATRAALQAAVEERQGAWKALVPFVVAARHASADAAARDAQGRLVRLQADAARQGCTVREG